MAVLLLSEVYGTLKGGISTIYRRLATILREREPDIPVFSAILEATEDDKEDARRDGVELLLPKVEGGDERIDTNLHWLTFDHRVKYPHLPSKIRTILGHTDGTSRAACGIKQDRCAEATVVLFIDDIPEDTEKYKGDEEAMGIGKKEDSILKDAEQADVVFSIGNRVFDHFKNQFRAIPSDKRPQHMLFVPRPSDVFEEKDAEYSDAETMVVLTICRVTGAEKLKGLDIAVEALSIVAGKRRIKLRVRGVDKEDLKTTKAILDHCKSANLQITFLPYGTQKDICKDMLQSHLVLMPSRAEPFGLVGLEAIAAGVPVLISDKSGLADLINKFAPHYHNCIVKMDISGNEESNAAYWAVCIEKVLEHCKEEFDTAANFKEELLSTRYWEESERQFINVLKGPPSAEFGDQGSRGSHGSGSDDESLNYHMLKVSEQIFDEEVLQDPKLFENTLSVFKTHVDAALPFKRVLSCKANLRVEGKAQQEVTRVSRVISSGGGLKPRYKDIVKCFREYCAILTKIEDGCVLCTLEFEDTLNLKSFLRGYRDGKLSETLTQELITEEMKQEGGPDLYVHVTLLVARNTGISDVTGVQGTLDKMEGLLARVNISSELKRYPLYPLQFEYLKNLAALKLQLGQMSNAMDDYASALALAREKGNEAEQMEVYFMIGEMHREHFRSQRDAIQCYEQFLTLAKDVMDRQKEGLAYNRLGLAHYEIGEYQEGHLHHQDSLKVSEDDKDTNMMIMANVNIGNTARLLGKMDKASSHLNTALQMALNTGDQRGQMEVYFWLGEMNREQLQNPRMALIWYKKHLAQAKKLADRHEERVAYNRLGMAHYEAEEYEVALERHRKSLEMREDVENQQPAYANIGDCCKAMGDIPHAKLHYQLALSLETGNRQRKKDIATKLESLDQ